MQKSGIMIISSAALIVIGLILLVVGNQIILGEIIQGNEKVNSSQILIISVDFNSQETSIGVFAVQIMEFKDNTFSAKVLDPFDREIIFQTINEETIEKEFDVLETGTYKLIIESISNEETIVFGAIGPLPDTGRKSLGFISVYILVIGMIGLIVAGIYGVKNRR